MNKTWEGDIDAKVYQRVKEKGYTTVREFAESLPTKSYVKLAEELGEDVAGIQIEAVLADEYQKTNELVTFIKSNLVRSICDNFPNGWNTEEDSNLKQAYTYAEVASPFVEPIDKKIEESWHRLVNLPQIFIGWLPRDVDDPILTEAFKDFENE
jgi:hypothetical protein